MDVNTTKKYSIGTTSYLLNSRKSEKGCASSQNIFINKIMLLDFFRISLFYVEYYNKLMKNLRFR